MGITAAVDDDVDVDDDDDMDDELEEPLALLDDDDDESSVTELIESEELSSEWSSTASWSKRRMCLTACCSFTHDSGSFLAK